MIVEPTPNIPLLRKVWEWVQSQEELAQLNEEHEWYQSSWIHFDHKEFEKRFHIEFPLTSSLYDSDGLLSDRYHEFWTQFANEPNCNTKYCIAGYTAHITPGVYWANDEEITVDGELRSISEWATEELGITGEEAEELFDSSTDFVTAKAVLTDVFERAGEKLE
jgi:hypothetical protein